MLYLVLLSIVCDYGKNRIIRLHNEIKYFKNTKDISLVIR